jgi:hypothetical protein
MAAAIGLRFDYDARSLRAIAKRSKDGPQARRLLALASIYDGGARSESAKIGGVTLQEVRNWVLRFPARLEEIAREKRVASDKIEVWCEDEARIGQKNKITRRWAKRRSRPSAPHDQRTASTYIFGAVCSKDGKSTALVLPACNTYAMNLLLAEISKTVALGVSTPRRHPPHSQKTL